MILTIFLIEPGYAMEEKKQEHDHLKIRQAPANTYDKFAVHQVLPSILAP